MFMVGKSERLQRRANPQMFFWFCYFFTKHYNKTMIRFITNVHLSSKRAFHPIMPALVFLFSDSAFHSSPSAHEADPDPVITDHVHTSNANLRACPRPLAAYTKNEEIIA